MIRFVKSLIYKTTEYLEKFLRNLLQGENNELHNREMHVSGMLKLESSGDPINDPINEPINQFGTRKFFVLLFAKF